MEPIFFDVEDGDKSNKICLVDFPNFWSMENLADLLVAQHSDDLEQTNLVILRRDVDTQVAEVDCNEYELNRLTRRVPNAEIRVLHSSKFKPQLSQNLVPNTKGTFSILIDDNLVDILRERELEHYARNCDALLPARNGFVYRAPSGHYMRQFLRVGNIQKSRQALDAVFFWMLPSLENCSAIIVDTWSIGSIALNAARLLERYNKNTRCRVELLPTYFDGDSGSYSETKNILKRIGRNAKGSTLVLFSAVRSGRSLNRFQEFLEQNFLHQDIKYQAIFALSEKVSINALCSRLKGFELVEREDAIITIDPSSYFPVTAKDKPLMIRKINAEFNFPFFDRYAGSNAIRIHRDVHDSGRKRLRHHAFDIDVESLLKNSLFLKRLHEKLQELPKISIIVTPPHDAGKLLGKKVKKFLSKKFRHPPKLIVNADLNPRDESLKKIFQETNTQTNILILDDVTNTGQRLSRFQANLRALEFHGHISYLLGVVRPDNELNWNNRVQNLKLSANSCPNRIDFVEMLVLPDWNQEKCPWCLEVDWLTRKIQNGNLREAGLQLAIDRRNVLNNANDREGLIKEVFWIPPGQSRPTLTQGSIFLPHECPSEADIVASVAGTIQRMRTDKDDENCLRNDFPQPRVLSPDNYLGLSPRFNDQILRTSTLRCARPPELRRWHDDDEAQRSILMRDEFIENQHNIALELAVAISQRKFSLVGEHEIDSNTIQASEVRVILQVALAEYSDQ